MKNSGNTFLDSIFKRKRKPDIPIENERTLPATTPPATTLPPTTSSSGNPKHRPPVEVPETLFWGDMAISKSATPEIWEKYAEKMRNGERPPKGGMVAPPKEPPKALKGVPEGTIIREPLFGRNPDGSPKPRPKGMDAAEVLALAETQERKYNPPQKATPATANKRAEPMPAPPKVATPEFLNAPKPNPPKVQKWDGGAGPNIKVPDDVMARANAADPNYVKNKPKDFREIALSQANQSQDLQHLIQSGKPQLRLADGRIAVMDSAIPDQSQWRNGTVGGGRPPTGGNPPSFIPPPPISSQSKHKGNVSSGMSPELKELEKVASGRVSDLKKVEKQRNEATAKKVIKNYSDTTFRVIDGKVIAMAPKSGNASLKGQMPAFSGEAMTGSQVMGYAPKIAVPADVMARANGMR